MAIPILIILLLIAVACAVGFFYAFLTQRAGVISVLHLVSNLAQGQYARRSDPTARGIAGELARAANALAAELEDRAAKAQEDSDHLVSLLAMLDHTNEIALATDNMDIIRLANPTAARVLERPVDALLGKHIDTVVHHPDLRALYRNAFSATGPVSAQVALQTPGRTLHCAATAATIYNGAHYRGTFIVLRDITEVARTLQMKTDFATNASHELRTPLASIRAAVETMKEAGTEDPDTTRRCIDIINNHVLRLQLMVQDLLDLSRVEDSRALVRSDRIDVQLVCDVLASSHTAQLAEKKLSLKIELSEDARSLKGDERLLTLILKNLVDNAIKFTPAGSIVIRTYIHTGPWPVDGNSAASGQWPAAGTATDCFVLEVQDTGIGIPPEDRERVFERFYTVNRSRGGADRGTGLGLSIVKHAASAMQGVVTLHSELGKGTTIRCIFPRRDLPAVQP
ncbi:MAG TPA: ATP-binding protein [Phycisphaerae bacterium]|jgi:two-component system phosphate regulon sensor histidine kinase PhoR|nr:ATP-binding protein [Phycisphaerae bacterium]